MDRFAKKRASETLPLSQARMHIGEVEHLPVRCDVTRTAQQTLVQRGHILRTPLWPGPANRVLTNWRWRRGRALRGQKRRRFSRDSDWFHNLPTHPRFFSEAL